VTWLNKIHVGDAIPLLTRMAEDGVRARVCVTSPPFYGLRSYLPDNHPDKAKEIGLEPTLHEFIDRTANVFDAVWDCMTPDGTLWVEMGDAYYSSGGTGAQGRSSQRQGRRHTQKNLTGNSARRNGMHFKNMMGQPWLLAFELQRRGWILRQEVIWEKPDCLSGGTWLYARTQKGQGPHMLKDLVRLDPATVQLWDGQKWTQVLKWSRSTNTDPKLELVLRSGERIGCTQDHLWPTARGLLPARDLVVGDFLTEAQLPDSDRPAPGYMTADVARLAGLYLAEGHVGPDGSSIVLSLHIDELGWLPWITSAAAYLGATVGHTVDGNNLSVRIYGEVAATAIRSLIGGRTAHDKHLQPRVWNMPTWVLLAVATGYLEGDGSREGDRIRLGFCRNHSLERDLRTLAARLGAVLTLNPVMANCNGKRHPAFRGEWRWSRSGHHNEKSRTEIVEIRASRARQFWDVTVADDPHLFALASGVLTHNCMPESAKDRPTTAHSHIFIFAKQRYYFWDYDALLEPVSPNTHLRISQALAEQIGSLRANGGSRAERPMKALLPEVREAPGQPRTRPKGVNPKAVAGWQKGAGSHKAIDYARSHDGVTKFKARPRSNADMSEAISGPLRDYRNVRSVWRISTEKFKGPHFATFPVEIPRRAILAGSEPGDVILDPFTGSGATFQAACELGRNFVGTELNPDSVVAAYKYRRFQVGIPPVTRKRRA
jgi:hypothetical protein